MLDAFGCAPDDPFQHTASCMFMVTMNCCWQSVLVISVRSRHASRCVLLPVQMLLQRLPALTALQLRTHEDCMYGMEPVAARSWAKLKGTAPLRLRSGVADVDSRVNVNVNVVSSAELRHAMPGIVSPFTMDVFDESAAL